MGNQQGGSSPQRDSGRPGPVGATAKTESPLDTSRKLTDLLPIDIEKTMSLIREAPLSIPTIKKEEPPKPKPKPVEASPALFDKMPVIVVCRIFSALSARELCTCSLVCHEFAKIAAIDNLWETKAMDEVKVEGLYVSMLHESATLQTSWKNLYKKYVSKQMALHEKRIARAVYDYQPRGVGETALSKGDMVQVVHVDEKNEVWCLIERLDRDSNSKAEEQSVVEDLPQRGESSAHANARGWVPSGYLEEIPRKYIRKRVGETRKNEEPEEKGTDEKEEIGEKKGLEKEKEADSSTPKRNSIDKVRKEKEKEKEKEKSSKTKEKSRMVRAIQDYVAANDDELSFKKYDLMTLLGVFDVTSDGIWVSIDEDMMEDSKKDEKSQQESGIKAGDSTVEDFDRYRMLWLKVSLTRKSEGGGTVTNVGKIPGNFVTEDVDYVTVLFDYEGCSEFELTLKKGQRVAVLERDLERGWLYAQSLGQRGWVPENYLTD